MVVALLKVERVSLLVHKHVCYVPARYRWQLLVLFHGLQVNELDALLDRVVDEAEF